MVDREEGREDGGREHMKHTHVYKECMETDTYRRNVHTHTHTARSVNHNNHNNHYNHYNHYNHDYYDHNHDNHDNHNNHYNHDYNHNNYRRGNSSL